MTRLTSDVCLSVCREHRTEVENRGLGRLKVVQIEVAHVTRDSDTTFKVKTWKVNLQVAGHTVAASRTACLKHVTDVHAKVI